VSNRGNISAFARTGLEKKLIIVRSAAVLVVILAVNLQIQVKIVIIKWAYSVLK